MISHRGHYTFVASSYLDAFFTCVDLTVKINETGHMNTPYGQSHRPDSNIGCKLKNLNSLGVKCTMNNILGRTLQIV